MSVILINYSFFPLVQSLCVFNQNNAFHNFHKRGQRSIAGRMKGVD